MRRGRKTLWCGCGKTRDGEKRNAFLDLAGCGQSEAVGAECDCVCDGAAEAASVWQGAVADLSRGELYERFNDKYDDAHWD